jgi:hypothetical protein
MTNHYKQQTFKMAYAMTMTSMLHMKLKHFVRFEVFTAVTMKNGVFWVLTRATRRKNPEYTILKHFVRFEVFTAVTMKNGVFWVLTRATRRNNPEDTILKHFGFKCEFLSPRYPILIILLSTTYFTKFCRDICREKVYGVSSNYLEIFFSPQEM